MLFVISLSIHIEARLVNRFCPMVVRSQFFTLCMAEKDLSHVADDTGIVIAT